MAVGNQKRFVKWSMIIGGIFAVLIITAIWLGYGNFTDNQGNSIERTFLGKLSFTLVIFLVFIFGYWLYNHQKRRDQGFKNKNPIK